MEKKYNIDELPSVVCRAFMDGSVCYFVVHNGREIYLTQEFGDLCAFLKGFFVALGYSSSSSIYQISLRDKMEYKF